eukprot:5031971-Heterocapsa_arctica.AAC.1
MLDVARVDVAGQPIEIGAIGHTMIDLTQFDNNVSLPTKFLQNSHDENNNVFDEDNAVLGMERQPAETGVAGLESAGSATPPLQTVGRKAPCDPVW